MKPYFSKLLTEQERAGSKHPSRKYGGRLKYDPDSDYEDEVNFVSSARRRQYGHNYKEFTDVLAPLYGYLEKSVGRHWDEVYSELCQNLDRRSVTGLHVFTHLWQYVDRNTVMCEDGKVRVMGRYFHSYALPDDFYIHPYTGILCASQERRWTWRGAYRRRKAKSLNATDWHPIWNWADQTGGAAYMKKNGIWYEVGWSTDYCSAEGIPYIERTVNDKGWVTSKKQLGKKELRHLGLCNTIPLAG